MILLIFVGQPILTLIGVAAIIASLARWPSRRRRHWARWHTC